MTLYYTRRTVIAAALSALGTAACANAPISSLRPTVRPSSPPKVTGDALVAAARLSGRVSYAVIDVATGTILDQRAPDTPIPPASVTKTITAAYAFDRLGGSHTYKTDLSYTGQIQDGVITGDLILQGSGDPTLDTDRLATLVETLWHNGIWRVDGRFFVSGGDFPQRNEIDPLQPPQVTYNPAISGLNLNYNRVWFNWEKRDGNGPIGYDISMRAVGKRYQPDIVVSRMQLAQGRDIPTYQHQTMETSELWQVDPAKLGGAGGRWLPTRLPLRMGAEAFRSIARHLQIALPPPTIGLPSGADRTPLARTHSAPLRDITRDMLKYSNNLMAEVLGFTASDRAGLRASAQDMADWAQGQGLMARFVDHSGLGDQSRVTATGLTQFLQTQFTKDLPPLLKDMTMDRSGQRRVSQGRVLAKTGTLNFVSTLAGYIVQDGRTLAFAILTDDLTKRAAIKPHDRERPAGAVAWQSRSRALQYALLDLWA
ncbi:MAG: D-alanyl-D-alanine carboxypeptidase/D-alanyl-D-alanine-endopeptidase [Pseudomonadota bacterium]